MAHVDNDSRPAAETEPRIRYPRGWARNPGFTWWKVAVAASMILGVPVTIWLLLTWLFR